MSKKEMKLLHWYYVTVNLNGRFCTFTSNSNIKANSPYFLKTRDNWVEHAKKEFVAHDGSTGPGEPVVTFFSYLGYFEKMEGVE